MVPLVLLWCVIPPVMCYSWSANSCAKASDRGEMEVWCDGS